MSYGLFTGSLVVLGIASIMFLSGYYGNQLTVQEDCEKTFSTYYGKCDERNAVISATFGFALASGVFIILGLITSIIFGIERIELVIDKRRISK
jgi:hypothetical protein